jgi:hypothetical protein
VPITRDELCFVNAKAGLGLSFNVFKQSNKDGVINSLSITNKSESPVTVQRGQQVGSLHLVETVKIPGNVLNTSNSSSISLNRLNKFSSPYFFASSSFDFSSLFTSFSESKRDRWMLLLEKWHTVLLLNKYDVGLTDVDYKIRLSDPTPIKLYIPRYSQGVREAISKELEKMKEANFIEPSISPFAAPMVCVRKGDGSLRVTIDFFMINKNTIANAYPLHRIDDQIDTMRGSAWFTTLDLTKGYHQMNLDTSSWEYTAFTTPLGLYQWKVLPMGMKTSGAVFQRLMDSVLGDLQPKIAVVYIDDITIFSPTLEQHYEDVNCVLERLSVANLKVNVNKCAFAREEVIVLGFKVS